MRRRTRAVMRLEALEARTLLHAGPVISGDSSHDHLDALPAEASLSSEIAPAAISAQALRPDLTPWASQSKGFLYDWTVQGNELRLTSAVANIGTGRLELRGGGVHGNSQDVYQRIYEPNGTFTDVLAGTFVYHPEHGHIHFEGFAQYRLRSVLPDGGVGDIVASGSKVSFCLLDVERYNSSGPASPQFLSCGQNQGISVGWADVYDRGLPDQSINIAGVANGTYWLEVVIDPENRLIESDETNNVQRIQITLNRGSGGGGAIPVDTFEPNDSFTAASILAPPEDHTYPNLSIHEVGNEDYFRVTASASGTLAFRVAFQNSQGDIDLEVFNASRSRLGRSASTGNSEQVSVNAVAGQVYFVRVFGYNRAVNPNYSLIVDQPAPVTPARFYLSTTAAGTLASTNGGPNVSFTDADILELTVQQNGQYQYQLRFDGSDVGLTTSSEDIDAFVFLPDGSILISTTGAFSVPAPGGGTLSGGGSDILRFVSTSVGANTAGQWSRYFAGSSMGLTTADENIDAIARLSDGRLLFSTSGPFSVTGASGQDEDLLAYTPARPGTGTSGTGSLWFDGSDVGLSTTSGEDINGLYVQETSGLPKLYFSTVDTFSVAGVNGSNEDAVAFSPTSLGPVTAGTFGPGLAFDGSLYGLASLNIDGIQPGPPPGSGSIAPAAQGSASSRNTASAWSSFGVSSSGPGEPSAEDPRTASDALADLLARIRRRRAGRRS